MSAILPSLSLTRSYRWFFFLLQLYYYWGCRLLCLCRQVCGRLSQDCLSREIDTEQESWEGKSGGEKQKIKIDTSLFISKAILSLFVSIFSNTPPQTFYCFPRTHDTSTKASHSWRWHIHLRVVIPSEYAVYAWAPRVHSPFLNAERSTNQG